MKKLILFLVAIISLSSCQKDNFNPEGEYEGTWIEERGGDTTYTTTIILTQNGSYYDMEHPLGTQRFEYDEFARTLTLVRNGNMNPRFYPSEEVVGGIKEDGYISFNYRDLLTPSNSNKELHFEGWKK